MKTQPLRITPVNLLGLGVTVLLLTTLLYLFARHWGQFVQYCINFQIYMHRYLVMYLLQQQNHQYSGGIMLVLGSFIYGFLHSIGPGHGKFVITTYLVTNRQQLTISRLITLAGSLMQGVVAILFVLILAVVLNLSMGDLSLSRYWVEKGSAAFIACFGLMLLWRAGGLRIRKPRILKALPISSATPLITRNRHDQDCSCGHKHLPDANQLNGGWRNALWVIAAIGIRPCSGAILILVFANAIGMFSWGVVAAMSMALGTALSIMILATLVHHLRERFIRTGGSLIGIYLPQAARIAMMLGGVLLILFALVLFSAVIPVSANGDFIAAGC
ncbi:High-affinity nickel-transport protein [Serratia fonticola]|uniref:nickel/cobalt transporter n=1 Tax=Serratia fonticola TaxID=47917 RepID=UPI002183B922|nr:nickel/cobalt transporter [Serratia fonticola]CAI2105133.1 High-affinity nickel-transport protein [Serratia fonticola]